jgi:SecD/SecF fusion protein
VLEAGKLPAELVKTPISEEFISPTLGLETIRKGTWAIIASVIAVLLFILVYYRFAGLVACLVLVANLVLTVGTMYLIGAAFTLPGLAGLVLTIGMSVDSNVLIFERMREELERGAALRMAIRNGFDRAMSAIIDSNLVALITGVVLYATGTDQLRGFAVTLIIGLTMSMFTGIFCSRILFDIAERRHWIDRLTMMRIFTHANYDFMKLRTPAIILSLIVIAVGMVAVYFRGNDLLDIDFTGGTSVTMVLRDDAKMPLTEVRNLLEEKTDLEERNLLVVERGSGGTTYTIDTNVDSVEQVQQILKDTFQGRLQTYSLEVSNVAPYTEGEATGTEATLVFASGSSDDDAGITRDALAARIVAALKSAGHEGLQPILAAPSGVYSENDRLSEWRVRLLLPVESAQPVLEALASKLSSEPVFPLANKIGGRVAGNMRQRAVIATIISLIGVMGYIWLRFQNFAFSLAAVIALIHDVLIMIGMLALSKYFVDALPGVAQFLLVDSFQIGLSVLAAILTLIGYSLNDTIVTFDRIREVRGKSPKLTGNMINLSINQTLSRTILTFLCTFIVVVILYTSGGPGIHAFSFALLVGMIAGTYSSIYIAAPILLWIAGDAEA